MREEHTDTWTVLETGRWAGGPSYRVKKRVVAYIDSTYILEYDGVIVGERGTPEEIEALNNMLHIMDQCAPQAPQAPL